MSQLNQAQEAAFNELWDALNAILEAGDSVLLPDSLREQGLWAIDRAQHVTDGVGFPNAKSPECLGEKGETSRMLNTPIE